MRLVPAYASNFLPWAGTSRPLPGKPATIDLVAGYSRTIALPMLALFLSRPDRLGKHT